MHNHRPSALSVAAAVAGRPRVRGARRLNVVAAGWLSGASCWRTCADPARAFGLFTFVAATDVLGTRLAVDGHHAVALRAARGRLARLAGARLPRPLDRGARPARRPFCKTPTAPGSSGSSPASRSRCWPPTLEPAVGPDAANSRWLAVFSWSVGVFLYAAVGVFVAARLLLYPLRPAISPRRTGWPMGATAITVRRRCSHRPHGRRPHGRPPPAASSPAPRSSSGPSAPGCIPLLSPPASGATSCTASRCATRPPLWSVVFPLGMYGVAGHYLGQADHLPIVAAIGADESWVALAAWTADLPGDAASPGPDGPADRYPLARRRWRRA